MASELLRIEGLKVAVDGKEILHGIDLLINEGEVHILFGPNGSGKSTLMNCILGLPGYEIISGGIYFKDKLINDWNVEERAKAGIGLSFQRPPVVRGVTLRKLLSGSLHLPENQLESLAADLNLTRHLDRDLNKGFSGGEVKRAEVLQLLVQSPDFVMLDEPESGVDLENIELLSNKLSELLGRGVKHHRPHKAQIQRSAFVISHTGYILNYITADRGHVLLNGLITCDANPFDILNVVQQYGYNECMNCVRQAEEENVSLTDILIKRTKERKNHEQTGTRNR